MVGVIPKLTGYETDLERSEAFRRYWEQRAKRSHKALQAALAAFDARNLNATGDALRRGLQTSQQTKPATDKVAKPRIEK